MFKEPVFKGIGDKVIENVKSFVLDVLKQNFARKVLNGHFDKVKEYFFLLQSCTFAIEGVRATIGD